MLFVVLCSFKPCCRQHPYIGFFSLEIVDVELLHSEVCVCQLYWELPNHHIVFHLTLPSAAYEPLFPQTTAKRLAFASFSSLLNINCISLLFSVCISQITIEVELFAPHICWPLEYSVACSGLSLVHFSIGLFPFSHWLIDILFILEILMICNYTY